MPEQAVISVITLGELRAGVLAAADPEELTLRLSTWEGARALNPLPVNDRVADTWATLRAALRKAGQRMPVNDSWIAATALAHGLPVFTQDDDYDGVPGLSVVKV